MKHPHLDGLGGTTLKALRKGVGAENQGRTGESGPGSQSAVMGAGCHGYGLRYKRLKFAPATQISMAWKASVPRRGCTP